jgi:hypothetical protein
MPTTSSLSSAAQQTARNAGCRRSVFASRRLADGVSAIPLRAAVFHLQIPLQFRCSPGQLIVTQALEKAGTFAQSGSAFPLQDTNFPYLQGK